jgi:hypothetical protein
VLQDGSDLRDTSRHDRGFRSTLQPPEPPKTSLSVAELIHHPRSISSVLTPVQREKLRSIPVPRHLQHQPNHNAQMSNTRESCSISSDNSRSRKRKVSEVDADDEDSENGRHPSAKNIAHNRTEKRYRLNLNDKIAAFVQLRPQSSLVKGGRSKRMCRRRKRGPTGFASCTQTEQGMLLTWRISKDILI